MPKKKKSKASRDDEQEVARLTNAGMKTTAWEKVAIYGAERIYGGEGAPSHGAMLLNPLWAEYVRKVKAERVRCQHCGAGHSLQVHHTYYRNDLLLWEYPTADVLLLCDKCHRKEHRLDAHRKRMTKQVAKLDAPTSECMGGLERLEVHEDITVTRRSAEEIRKEEREKHAFLQKNDPKGIFSHLQRKPQTPWD